MFEFLKTKNFHKFFSLLLGIFIVLVLRPVCKDEECYNHMTPDPKIVALATYQIGSKCYTFTPKTQSG